MPSGRIPTKFLIPRDTLISLVSGFLSEYFINHFNPDVLDTVYRVAVLYDNRMLCEIPFPLYVDFNDAKEYFKKFSIELFTV
ncbi:hypothetical protein [Dipodfec virus UA06Rod_3]|uniref:Uncharacterized protein n=1 Tax=Dipodfec virus UA06Rod_3 TaxID=2929323 RepID=A0A976N208_9VIRU|nr:hypothetical protein [Dipodfec virus UA06Rod_3]